MKPLFAIALTILLCGCTEAFDSFEAVLVCIDPSGTDMLPDATIAIWGNSSSVIAADGSSDASFLAGEDSRIVKGRPCRILAPQDGGLRWLPKADVATFYAISPAGRHPAGERGVFDGLDIPERQTAADTATGILYSDAAVVQRGKAACLWMNPAYTLVEICLDVTGLPAGHAVEAAALSSTMASLCGGYSVNASSGVFRCPPRAEDNARVEMLAADAIISEGRLVFPMIILPQAYSQLTLEVTVSGEKSSSRVSYVLSSPEEPSVPPQSRAVVEMSLSGDGKLAPKKGAGPAGAAMATVPLPRKPLPFTAIPGWIK